MAKNPSVEINEHGKKLSPEEFALIEQGIKSIREHPSYHPQQYVEDFWLVIDSHRAYMMENAQLEAIAEKWNQAVVAPVLRRPNKNWDTCPLEGHADDCVCGGQRSS